MNQETNEGGFPVKNASYWRKRYLVKLKDQNMQLERNWSRACANLEDRAKEAEEKIAKAVRECERIAQILLSVPGCNNLTEGYKAACADMISCIHSRFPEYFKESE